MAIVDLNNLVRPKQTNNSGTALSNVVNSPLPIYTDLHLDLSLSKNIGLGIDTVPSSDLLVDNDIDAIKNSIKNIFTTKKGEKVLNPEFGCSLDQYLFEPITEVYAQLIGNDILTGIQRFEPRVEITNITVIPVYDQNLYYITCYYTLLQIQKQSTINLIAQLGGEILV